MQINARKQKEKKVSSVLRSLPGLSKPENISTLFQKKLLKKLEPKIDRHPKGSKTVAGSAGWLSPMNHHIVGGSKVFAGVFPWQAAILSDENTFCGGSLIDEVWVLTAAQCIGR